MDPSTGCHSTFIDVILVGVTLNRGAEGSKVIEVQESYDPSLETNINGIYFSHKNMSTFYIKRI